MSPLWQPRNSRNIQKLNHPQVIPWKQEVINYKEGLRADVFNAFRHQSSNGDWWMRLDVDEFYRESPRTFFARIPKGRDFVWGIMVEYVLTEKDIAALDFSQPFESIMHRLHHYYVAHSEPRAFRYRDGLVWNEDWAWPRHAGVVARERIIYSHYPCRSPQQWQTRLKIRKENYERGFGNWNKDTEIFRETIKNSKDFLFDDGASPLKIAEAKLPRHIEKPHVRLLKQLLHRSGIWP
jgi:hypothetical protein